MTQDDYLGNLSSILSDILGEPVTLRAGTVARDIPGWDSLVQMTFMLLVEKDYGIELSMKEISEFENVGALAATIAAKKEGRA